MSLWTPDNVADLAFWGDASDSANVVLDVDDKVEELQDVNGSVRVAEQTTSGNRPTTVSEGVNNLDTIAFNGSDQWLTFGTAFGKPANYTIFTVATWKTLSGTRAVCGSTAWNAPTATSWGLVETHNSFGERKQFWSYGDDADARYGYSEEDAFTKDATSINCVKHTDGVQDETIYSNGTELTNDGLTGTADEVSGTAYDFSIGRNGAWAASYFHGELCEILIYTASLSDSDREKVEGYLAHKWGLAGNLPSTHPYKTSAPTTLPPWTPANITTALWLDAADATTLTFDVSDNVEQWDDKSGNNRHATQGTSGKRPGYATNTFNGEPTLTFDGEDVLAVASNDVFRVSGGLSVFVVLERTSTATNRGWIGRWNSGQEEWLIARESSGDEAAYAKNSANSNIIADAGAKAVGQYIQSLTVVDDGSLDFHINGAEAATISFGTAKAAVDCPIAIGAYEEAGLTGFTGKISEVIILSEKVSTEKRQLFEGYFAWKWGLEDELPIGHPYKNSAPLGGEHVFAITTSGSLLSQESSSETLDAFSVHTAGNLTSEASTQESLTPFSLQTGGSLGSATEQELTPFVMTLAGNIKQSIEQQLSAFQLTVSGSLQVQFFGYLASSSSLKLKKLTPNYSVERLSKLYDAKALTTNYSVEKV